MLTNHFPTWVVCFQNYHYPLFPKPQVSKLKQNRQAALTTQSKAKYSLDASEDLRVDRVRRQKQDRSPGKWNQECEREGGGREKRRRDTEVGRERKRQTEL